MSYITVTVLRPSVIYSTLLYFQVIKLVVLDVLFRFVFPLA
jgi:hypothetical protein